ncbi:MAG: cation:proton antiporter [Candidatus Altiarchaeota archaeon]|nr:cation:proton antiporter [Candidatus Altiarchaeota archaeon]
MRDEIIIMSALIVFSGFIALELGFTTAILELFAGMIAGHFIDFTEVEIVEVLADLGILTLMYVAGLEIDFDQLQKRFKPSLVIGSASFFFPFLFVFGFLQSILLMEAKQASLVAIALSTTSISIVYPILRQAGDMTEDRKLILSSAMMTEILGISVLSVFFTPNPVFILFLIGGLFLFAKLFPFLGGKIFRYYKGNVAEFEFKIILLLLLAVAVISEQAGFEAAILAFLTGMITSEIVVQHENLEMKLRGIVFGFFAPVFFFWVGLRIKFWSLLNNLPLLLVFFVICFAAKYAGTYLAGRFFIPEKAKYTAILFNANLTIGIIIAFFGYESVPQILSFEVFSAIIGAVILSSMSSIWLCRAKMPEY